MQGEVQDTRGENKVIFEKVSSQAFIPVKLFSKTWTKIQNFYKRNKTDRNLLQTEEDYYESANQFF